MTTLATRIRQYYWEHFAELPEATQFHFANRLAAWEKDSKALTFLDAIHASYVPADAPALRTQLEILLVEAPRTAMPAYEQRLPFFEQYPQLYGLHQALFRVRHLEEIYDIRATKTLLELISAEEVRQLLRELQSDPEALRTLSTLAVNTIYLAQRYCLQQPDVVNPADFFALRDGYNVHNPDELRLLVYLLTHCIIADSNFYSATLSAQHRTTYNAILQYLEILIGTHFADLSLDAKLEFLVCCRIVGLETSVRARVETECAQSISPEGTFLIDVHNHFANNPLKRGFAASEHRNVLYILSQSPYQLRPTDQQA